MSEITKEELAAFTEAHAKVAVALEQIASRLGDITLKQDKIVDKMANGLADVIITGVVSNYNATHKETVDSLKRNEDRLKEFTDDLPELLIEKIDNSKMSKNIEKATWFILAAGALIVVANVVLNVIDHKSDVTKEVHQVIEQLKAEDK